VPFGLGLWLDWRAQRDRARVVPVHDRARQKTAVHDTDMRQNAVHSRIVLMMPALNEAMSLPLVFEDLQLLQQRTGLLDEIIVVDNGSTDATAQIARRAGATVLAEPQQGYGVACLRALTYLRQSPPDIVVFMDADRSDDAQEIPDLVRPLQENGMDLVIGSRTRGMHDPGALLPQARFGNWLATILIRWTHGFAYTDLGPFRAVRFAALERLRMTDRDFGWTVEMQVRAIQENLRICEVPVRYRRRVGHSKISGTIGGSVRAGAKIIATLWRLRRPS
jgi:glycosyltransferase involved in cell wall biosynthesis